MFAKAFALAPFNELPSPRNAARDVFNRTDENRRMNMIKDDFEFRRHARKYLILRCVHSLRHSGADEVLDQF